MRSPEVEVVFLPGRRKVQWPGRMQRVVVSDPTAVSTKLARKAHVVVADCDVPAPHAFYRFRLNELPVALKTVA